MINLFHKRFYKTIRAVYETGWIGKKEALKIINVYKYNEVFTCEICKKPIHSNNDNMRCSFDHILPQSRGGLSNLDNLRCTHMKCNSNRKHNTYL